MLVRGELSGLNHCLTWLKVFLFLNWMYPCICGVHVSGRFPSSSGSGSPQCLYPWIMYFMLSRSRNDRSGLFIVKHQFILCIICGITTLLGISAFSPIGSNSSSCSMRAKQAYVLVWCVGSWALYGKSGEMTRYLSLLMVSKLVTGLAPKVRVLSVSTVSTVNTAIHNTNYNV